MSQEFDNFRAALVTEAQTYVEEHLKEWPCDQNHKHVVDWPDENCEIATNCSKLDNIDQFQAKTDALPNYKLPRMAYQSVASMEVAESRWTMKNKDIVEASLQNLIQCVRDHDPKISVYEGISEAAFKQVSAQEDTKLHYQSPRPGTSTTMNPDTDLPRNDQAQVAQSEADANRQLSRS